MNAMNEYTIYLNQKIVWPKPTNFRYLDWRYQDGIPPKLDENEHWQLVGVFRRSTVRIAVVYPKHIEHKPTEHEVKEILVRFYNEKA